MVNVILKDVKTTEGKITSLPASSKKEDALSVVVAMSLSVLKLEYVTTAG